MKVLALSSYANLGGAEIAQAAFVEHRPPGVEVEALVIGRGPFPERLEALGIPVMTAPGFDPRPDPRTVVRFTRSLWPLLSRLRPDVVWANGLKAATLAGPACRLRGVPLVWHKVDQSWDGSLAGPVGLLTSGIIPVAEASAAALGPARRRVLGYVGPPVTLDPALRSDPDPERPVIGTLARLVPYKGHHHIVAAAALVREEFPSLSVALVGGEAAEYPGYADEVRALARERGVPLDLPGFTSDVGPFLARMNVFMNATYRDEEGFGNEGLSGAILEAMWAGIPVVATDGGGTAEAVEDGVRGTLVTGPEPEALAAAVARYLRDPALARAHGAAAREWAHQHFAPEPSARRVFELLASVTG